MTTYSEQALADIARIEADNAQSPDYIKFAGIAGAVTACMRHYAACADAEAAHNKRITKSISEYEKAAPVYAMEWDEVHDFCDFLLAGLEMRYDDCEPSYTLESVRDAFRTLQRALGDLDSVRNAQDVLAAHVDAQIKERKESVSV